MSDYAYWAVESHSLFRYLHKPRTMLELICHHKQGQSHLLQCLAWLQNVELVRESGDHWQCMTCSETS